jgi:hypothetical protein
MKLLRRFSFGFLLAVLLACGDGTFFFSISSGTITGDPFCDRGGGRFDLRDQGGLVIVVVIESDTTIVLASGSSGTCNDLAAGNDVDVRGAGEGDSITAREIVVN